MSALKQALFDEYGGFADKRYKKLTSSNVFAIDGRTSTDVASDGKLYGWFCAAFADTSTEPAIKVRLVSNVPDAPEVRAWVTRYGASRTTSPEQVLEFTVAPGEQRKLLNLAVAFESIVRPGRRYRVASYKHVCPRLGKALRRLEAVLTKQWSRA